MLVGAVYAQLKAEDAQFVAAMQRAAARLGQLKQEAFGAGSALGNLSENAKKTAASAQGLDKTAAQAKGKMSELAGSMGQLTTAMGSAGGQAQKLVGGMAGLVGSFTSGGGLGVAAGAAALAMGIVTEAMEKQEREAKKLDDTWQNALASFIAFRNEQAQKFEGAQVQTKALELRADGMSPEAAQAQAEFEQTATKQEEKRATAAAEHAQAVKRINAEYQQLINRIPIELRDEERLTEEVDKRDALLRQANDAYASQVSLLSQVVGKAEEGVIEASKAHAIAEKVARLDQLRATALANQYAAIDDQKNRYEEILSLAMKLGTVGVGAGMTIVPGASGAAMALAAATNQGTMQRPEHADYMSDDEMDRAAKIALRDMKLRHDGEAKFLEDQALINDIMADEVDQRRVMANEMFDYATAMQKAERSLVMGGVGEFGKATIEGHGGASAFGALGGAAGAAASAAMGDPTGISGGMIGGALGNVIGGLVDKLQPLQDAGAVVLEAFTDVVAMAKPLFDPLVLAAKAFKATIDATLVPYAGKLDHFFGAVGRTLLAVVDAGLPLVGLFVEFNPAIMAIAWAAERAAPAINEFALGVEDFAKSTFKVANEFVLLANSLGAHIERFDDEAVFAAACFTGRTLVLTPAGTRPISDVCRGDIVVGYDEKTGEKRDCVVAGIMSRGVRGLVLVEIDDETIETTSEHPFWVAGSGWTNAGELVAGDQLRRSDSTWARVLSVRAVAMAGVVYNLEISDTHTYFVGRAGVLVHNKDAEKEALKLARAQAKATEENTDALNAFNRRTDNMPLGEKVLRMQEFASATPHVRVDLFLNGKKIDANDRLSMQTRYGSILARTTRLPDNKN